MFYSAQNEQAIASLCPTVQAKAQALMAECENQGVWLKITCAYRSWALQAWLYAQGRFRPGPIVTYAKPGRSMHQFRIAIDTVPADGQGGIHYADMDRVRQIALIAKAQGWSWGGDWPGWKDFPHLEFLGGHDEAYFMRGGKI